jgi:hypothetical protein
MTRGFTLGSDWIAGDLGSGRDFRSLSSRAQVEPDGVTGFLYQRVLQHKAGEVEGFTSRHNIKRLAYYEVFEHVGNAITRERQITAWTRAKRGWR